MRIRAALLGAACVLVFASCNSDQRAISRDDLPDVPTEPSEVVEIDDDGFDVDRIEVTTDELVEFVNTGEEDHGIRTETSSIDTGLLFPGESTFVMFDEPDRYQLFDVADDTSTMTVVATDPAVSSD